MKLIGYREIKSKEIKELGIPEELFLFLKFFTLDDNGIHDFIEITQPPLIFIREEQEGKDFLFVFPISYTLSIPLYFVEELRKRGFNPSFVYSPAENVLGFYKAFYTLYISDSQKLCMDITKVLRRINKFINHTPNPLGPS